MSPPSSLPEVVSESSPEVVSESSPEGSEAEIQAEGTSNGSKKLAWVKPSNAVVDGAQVMGDVSWPSLSESSKAPRKPSSIDSSKSPIDQGTSVDVPAPATPELMASSPNGANGANGANGPNPNANSDRNKSIKREGGVKTSKSSSPMYSSQTNTTSVRTSSGVDGSRRDHGHVNGSRDSNYRSGNYRRNSGGSWNNQRSFNGRGPVFQPQRGGGGPRGVFRPPPPPAAYFPPPTMRPYFSQDMRPVYYLPPHPRMPFAGQMTPPVFYAPVDTELSAQIIKQIDYYFSNENLVKDIYLRQNMDEFGWVPVQLIANFNKILQLTTDIQLILNAMHGSTMVEVQGEKMRKRTDWMKWIIASSIQLPVGTGSQSPRTPTQHDILGARVQGLVLKNNPDKDAVDAGILPRSSSEAMDGK